MKIPEHIIEWLVKSNPWTEYNTRVELLGEKKNSEQVITARKNMLKHPLVNGLLEELNEWPGFALKRHNDAKHLIHKLALVADLGIDTENATIKKVVKKIFEQQEETGAFQIVVNVPTHFGGSGEDELSWMLCDSPTIIYALEKMGFGNDERVIKAIEYFGGKINDNGWHCTVAEKFRGFKGPGRKGDPCPYVNLLMVKVLALTPKWTNSEITKKGIETLLQLWDERKERRPYLFAMGTRFTKLKTPFIWYDILHLLEVLTQFKELYSDSRVQEMIEILQQKANTEGLYYAESVWREFKEWDFGQKREPSPWITYQVYKILNMMK